MFPHFDVKLANHQRFNELVAELQLSKTLMEAARKHGPCFDPRSERIAATAAKSGEKPVAALMSSSGLTLLL